MQQATIPAPSPQRDTSRPRPLPHRPPAMPPPRALACLRALCGHETTHGHVPSYVELAALLGVHARAAIDYCQVLQRVGLVAVSRGLARTLTVTDAGRLVADGWEFGPPDVPGMPATVAADAEVAAEMRCPRCRAVGRSFVPLRRGLTYGGLYACPACGDTEEA